MDEEDKKTGRSLTEVTFRGVRCGVGETPVADRLIGGEQRRSKMTKILVGPKGKL